MLQTLGMISRQIPAEKRDSVVPGDFFRARTGGVTNINVPHTGAADDPRITKKYVDSVKVAHFH